MPCSVTLIPVQDKHAWVSGGVVINVVTSRSFFMCGVNQGSSCRRITSCNVGSICGRHVCGLGEERLSGVLFLCELHRKVARSLTSNSMPYEVPDGLYSTRLK